MALLFLVVSGSSGRAESPYEVHLPIDVGATVLLAGGAAVFQFTAPDSFHLGCHPCDETTVNALDRWAVGEENQAIAAVTDGLLALAMASPVIISGLEGLMVEQEGAVSGWLTDSLVAAEVLASTLFLTQVAKHVVQRQRPYTYALEDDGSAHVPFDASRSFFSGHTAAAFAGAVAMATTLSRRNVSAGVRTAAWTGGLLLASGVGVGRVLAAKHFPTDVLTGAAVGAALGWFIPWLHARSVDESTRVGPEVEVVVGPLGLSGTF